MKEKTEIYHLSPHCDEAKHSQIPYLVLVFSFQFQFFKENLYLGEFVVDETE
jgi:hypothetical protein